MRAGSAVSILLVGGFFATVGLVSSLEGESKKGAAAEPVAADHFVTSDRCMACHNGMETSDGETLSFGVDWRTSMMANAARDPYWQASVRREVTDHPQASAAIENECSRCHMPMTNATERRLGLDGQVFAHLPIASDSAGSADNAAFAADGVSCVVCHRIEADGLGEESSFTGGFEIRLNKGPADASIYGPYVIEAGRIQLMRSAVDHLPMPAEHIRSSELCATCHTLITESLGPDGSALGEFPEQVPYLEWRHSDYVQTQSCQSCHMPLIEEAPITSILGEPREDVRRHTFRGGNFFMQRMLSRYRQALGVDAPSADLELAARRTEEHLQEASAKIEIDEPALVGRTLQFDVRVENMAGHKLPTAYPSRRVWLHVVVRDAQGTSLFTSGEGNPDGTIAGNDNDSDPSRFEPHYDQISAEDQVQIYEPILGNPSGQVTTGLLTATQYLKDNRLLPRGFNKASAEPWIRVHGSAVKDANFVGGGDRVRYRVEMASGRVPHSVEVFLRYQPIGYRWAKNLEDYASAEPQRFTEYYRSMADESSTALASSRVLVDPR